MPPPLLPASVFSNQFEMGQHGWELVYLEGTGPTAGIVQHSPQRPSPSFPVRAWVALLMCGSTTYSGWYITHGDQGNSPVSSLDRHQYPPRPPPIKVSNHVYSFSGTCTQVVLSMW